MKHVTTATVLLRNEELTVRAGMAVRDVLLHLDLEPDAYLAIRKDELLTDDIIIQPGETLRLIAVISGGSGLQPARAME